MSQAGLWLQPPRRSSLPDAQRLRIRRPYIAVRPIATVHQAILAEIFPQLIQASAIEIQVFGHTAVDAAQDFGNLGISVRAFAQLSQISLKRLE